MKITKANLTLTKASRKQLKKFTNIDKGLSDIINNYLTYNKGRPNSDGVALHTLIQRAYYNNRNRYEFKFTKEEFVRKYENFKPLQDMYDNYVTLGFDKRDKPSFRMHRKLEKILIMEYSEIMKRTNSIPITVSYFGEMRQYASINELAKEYGVTGMTIKSAVIQGYFGDENIKLWYA